MLVGWEEVTHFLAASKFFVSSCCPITNDAFPVLVALVPANPRWCMISFIGYPLKGGGTPDVIELTWNRWEIALRS